MRTIGLIGGMSWESSALYYRLLNEEVVERLGGLHSARCILFSVDFADVAAAQRAARWDDAGADLADAARALEKAGAEVLLLCTNTMHKVADQVQQALTIPLLHIADTTADAVQADDISRVGLLGTAFTMEDDFYRARLASRGLDVQVPEAADRAIVHSVIYDELCLGVIRDESREDYQRVIDSLVDRGCEGIILGCTEIELLVGPDNSPVPTFPTTRLHAVAAVKWALAERESRV
jgi:aspartate racemase